MGKATEEQLNNPLHGVKLVQLLEHLVEFYGWETMAQKIPINCFKTRPSIKSSLRFLRRTEWAREKVENLYLESLVPVVHESVIKMWNNFVAENPSYAEMELPESWYFCDNEKDANETAELTKQGIKQATSTSLWWFEKNNVSLPQPESIYIVTDWYRVAKAIIKTTKIEKLPFKEIDEIYAKIEGEGDRSLAHWREVHWNYFKREMEEFSEEPTEEMIIICEYFETIYQ